MNSSDQQQGNTALAKFKLYYEELPGSDEVHNRNSRSHQNRKKS